MLVSTRHSRGRGGWLVGWWSPLLVLLVFVVACAGPQAVTPTPAPKAKATTPGMAGAFQKAAARGVENSPAFVAEAFMEAAVQGDLDTVRAHFKPGSREVTTWDDVWRQNIRLRDEHGPTGLSPDLTPCRQVPYRVKGVKGDSTTADVHILYERLCARATARGAVGIGTGLYEDVIVSLVHADGRWWVTGAEILGAVG